MKSKSIIGEWKILDLHAICDVAVKPQLFVSKHFKNNVKTSKIYNIHKTFRGNSCVICKLNEQGAKLDLGIMFLRERYIFMN